MSKSVQNRQVPRRNTRVLAAAISALVLAGNAFSQSGMPSPVDAQLPVTVNVAATVKIDPPSADKGQGAQESVTANTAKTINFTLLRAPNASISHHRQTPAGSGAYLSQNRGNITINLNSQQYNNAAISLHSISGKRILSGSASASKGALNISRASIPAGVYLLSVKGTKGSSFTSKLTHSGNYLSINVAFSGENNSSLKKSAAEDYGTWTITVSATGYTTQTRTFSPVEGMNPAQTFNLAMPPVAQDFTETVGSVSFDMIYMEGGTFTLGCESGTCPADSDPVAGVKVSNYFIAKNEVTNGLWKAVMGASDSRVPSYAQNPVSMTNMTWYDAMEFACKLSQMTGKNYRMTTEAEWEYAAKKPNSAGMGNMNSNEEWAYNSWNSTHTGGTDPVGQITYADGKINLHTQKTRRDAQLTASNITGRLIRSIDGIGPALRLTLSAGTDFPPNYVPPCEIHPPVLGGEPANSYRDPRWVTGSDKHWTTGSIAIGSFDLRVWDDGTARLGSTNGQWFTSNNIAFVFVPSSGSSGPTKFAYIFLDETQGSLISDKSFMSGGFIGRIAKESTTNLAKPSVTLAASAEALAKAQSNFETDYKMVDMVNIPASAKKQDSRLLDGTGQGWFQDNREAGGQHHYRKDVDADEFRFTVNQGGQRTMLANGTWFTVNNTFLRVTHSGGYVADYLYAYVPAAPATQFMPAQAETFYHNSFMAYERADFRMFAKTANNSDVFSATCGSTCSGEIPKGQSAPVYANMGETGKSTFVPAPCPAGGCN